MHEREFAFTRRLPGADFDEVVQRVRELLPSQGFGVLTEIDVRATLKKKLDVERAPYVILGACNPQFAHEALEVEPPIGVFLPCNVDIFVDGDDVYVQTVAPEKMFAMVDNPALEPIAAEVGRRLRAVLAEV